LGEQINIELESGELIELHFSSLTQAVRIVHNGGEIAKLSARKGGVFSQHIGGKLIEIESKRPKLYLSDRVADALSGTIRMNKVEAKVDGVLVFEGYAGQ